MHYYKEKQNEAQMNNVSVKFSSPFVTFETLIYFWGQLL